MACHLELRLAIDANLLEERDLALSHQHVEHGAPQGRALPPDGLHEFITRLLCGRVSSRDTGKSKIRAQLLGSGPTLLATLEALVAARWVRRGAARALGIHINSMGYRIERIEGLTGLSLDDPETRVAVAIALRARAMLGM